MNIMTFVYLIFGLHLKYTVINNRCVHIIAVKFVGFTSVINVNDHLP